MIQTVTRFWQPLLPLRRSTVGSLRRSEPIAILSARRVDPERPTECLDLNLAQSVTARSQSSQTRCGGLQGLDQWPQRRLKATALRRESGFRSNGLLAGFGSMPPTLRGAYQTLTISSPTSNLLIGLRVRNYSTGLAVRLMMWRTHDRSDSFPRRTLRAGGCLHPIR